MIIYTYLCSLLISISSAEDTSPAPSMPIVQDANNTISTTNQPEPSQTDGITNEEWHRLYEQLLEEAPPTASRESFFELLAPTILYTDPIENRLQLFEELQQLLNDKKELELDKVIDDGYLELESILCELDNTQKLNILKKISQMTWLTELHLYSNDLTYIPPEIGNLTNLTVLNLSGNDLENLPSEIGKLTNLQQFSFFDNPLTNFPEWIGNLTKLEELTLEGVTTLTSLPEWMRNLTNLTELRLYRNQLLSLPEWISDFQKLQELYISDDHLLTLPASINNIWTLTILDLSNCPNILPRSDTPDQLGRLELVENFGDNVILSDSGIQIMPEKTTEDDVYSTLDNQPEHINRDRLAQARLPELQVDQVFSGEEMLKSLDIIISSLNLTDPSQEHYLSYEILSGDFARDTRGQQGTNLDKIRNALIPRLTGYIRTLYDMGLKDGDIAGWKMFSDQQPQTQLALTYIIDNIQKNQDPGAKSLLFTQLVHGLLHCPTGQSEGINAVAFALLEGSYITGDFSSQLNQLIALQKNKWFTTSVLLKAANNPQSVHLISYYRDMLKDTLGLTSTIQGYTERIGTFGRDPFSKNQFNVLQVFYELVTPDRLVGWVASAFETQEDKTFIKLQRELEAAIPQKLSERQIKRLKDLKSKSGTSTLAPQEQLILKALESSTKMIDSPRWLQFLIDHDFIQWNNNLPNDWWYKWFTTDPAQSSKTGFTENGRIKLLQYVKTKIKQNKQFRPLTTGDALRYLQDKGMINPNKKSWWKKWFTADPLSDDMALLNRNGMKAILINAQFITQRQKLKRSSPSNIPTENKRTCRESQKMTCHK